ncbi:MAG: response regulator [Saprospiraceae bacterium]|nr:response regulator [Saprospiraceae bacterium]
MIGIFSHPTVKGQSSELFFEQINIDKTHTSSMISSIVQDNTGFIWLGTEIGLLRYDGNQFVRYTRDQNVEGSINNNRVNVIFEDSEGTLWIGTSNGVNHYDKNTKLFTPIDILPIKGGRNYITSFVEDNKKNIWVGTFGGVKLLNKEKKLLESVAQDSNTNLFTGIRVLSLLYDEKIGILVGTAEGLMIFDPNNGKVKKLPAVVQENQSLNKAKIWQIVQDDIGDLWFATKSNGVFQYERQKNKVINYTESGPANSRIGSNWVYDILPIDDHTIWFGTIDGLSVLNKKSQEITTYRHNAYNPYSLSDNEVRSFLKDKNGSVWLGTTEGGLNFFNQANYNFINIGESIKPNFGLTNPIVNSVVRENDDALWVGTNGGGLNFVDLKSKKVIEYKIRISDKTKTSNMINVLAEFDNVNLLCGTVNGLYNFNKNNKDFKVIPLRKNEQLLPEFPVTSLVVDEKKIWVGTEGDGLKLIQGKDVIINYRADSEINVLSDNFVTDIEFENNNIWIATQDGLNQIDKISGKLVKIFRSEGTGTIANNNLTSLFADSKERLWIGTDYGGLCLFDKNDQMFMLINKAAGLTNNSIKSITEDNQGNIWVTSDGLLYKIATKKFQIPYQIKDLDITSFSSSDGLTLGQFSDNCSIRLKNNKLVFGGSKGLTIFDSKDIFKLPNTSEIVLTKLKINNKEVNVSDKDSPLRTAITYTSDISLNYDQGNISIEFSAMNFVNPENNVYAYKLEKESRADEWHEIGNQNTINLIDLDHGNYTLSIRTSNEENVWNNNIKTLEINIAPPWWKSWWAHSLYFLLSMALIYTIIRIIKIRTRLQRALFVEQVEKERQQELYKMKLAFFTNVSHELRTPLTLMIAPMEDLIDGVEKNSTIYSRLKTIKNNTDRLLKLVNELLDFRKAENGLLKIHCRKYDIVSFCFDIYESFKGIAIEKKIKYKFVIDTNSVPVYFDKDQMEKVVYNLLSNAFKFTKENGKIVFSVECANSEEGWIKIKGKDNGIGIPEESKKNVFTRFFQIENRSIQNSGTGVGLALSQSIVELHKGELILSDEKDPWANTSFEISLRLGKAHIDASAIEEEQTFNEDLFMESEDYANKLAGETEDFMISENPVTDLLPIIDQEEKLAKKTILLVEDNVEFRRFTKEILSVDYNIVDFSNGKDAIRHMENELPDLVISDIMMPEMDGLELCEYIKTNESTNHLPVILLTAKSSNDSKIEGLTTGADSYIAKPFSIKILQLNIHNLLLAKEIMRQKYSGNFIIDSDLKSLKTPEELFIKKLMEIIESKLDDPEFDVNVLIKEIGISRTVLYKKVSTLTNFSVATLIKHVRLKKAADILVNTSYSVFEIADMVGFNDRKHFSKEFKKVYKKSPSDYKLDHLSGTVDKESRTNTFLIIDDCNLI